MNNADRFSLLLLEPGEIFFSDHSVVYRVPTRDLEEREEWENFLVYSEIKGRLKICSKSLVFDPRVKEIPLMKFPLKSCVSIEKGKAPPPQDPTVYHSDEECSIEVESEVTVEILEKNVIKPYKFRRKKHLHCFDLNYKKASDVLPQILQLQRAATLPPNDQNVMIEAIVRSLQKRRTFDYSIVKNPLEEKIVEVECSKVTPLVTNPGRVLVTSHALYYQSFNSIDMENSCLRIPVEDIKQVIKRRYLLRHVGIELFYSERTFSRYLYLIFKLTSNRENFYACLMKQERLHLENYQQENILYKWQTGTLSNFEYLSHLNSLADRSVNDLTQYPVFPWVISDYTSETLELSQKQVFRDLSKPVGALNEERLKRLKERRNEMPEPKFLYGSHYSTPGFVLYYLVRQFPLYMLCLQNGKFDHPDRMFNSLGDTWSNVTTNPSDFKELIPEFYDISTEGEFLKNRKSICFGTRQNGEPVWDVELPPWARDAADLVNKLREALESSYVSCNLHQWIDLIFGFKQKGEAAVKADNGNSIHTFTDLEHMNDNQRFLAAMIDLKVVFKALTGTNFSQTKDTPKHSTHTQAVFYHLCYEGSVDLEAITDLNEKISLENQIMEFGQIPKQLFSAPHPEKSKSLCLYEDLVDRGTIPESENDVEVPRLLWFFHNLEFVDKLAEAKLHRNSITQVTFTEDGETIISLSKDGSLKAYSFPDLKRIGHLDSGSLTFSSCVHLPNSNEVLVGSWDNFLYRFNYKLCQKRDGMQAHSDAITCLDVNGDVLVTGSWDCLVRVWDAEGMNSSCNDSGWSNWRVHMDKLICQMDHDGPVNCVALHPKVDIFASATTDGFLNVWLLKKDLRILNKKCHEGSVNQISWSLDGDRILSCGEDSKLVLVNSQTVEFVSIINLEVCPKSFIWDGRMVLVGGGNGIIIFYDMLKEQVIREFEAHSGNVSSLCLAPSRRFLVSGGEDKRVLLWGINI